MPAVLRGRPDAAPHAAAEAQGLQEPVPDVEYQVVNLDKLAELFPDGGDVDPGRLVDEGAVRKGQLVKVLGNGEIAVALTVRAHAFSGVRASRRSPPPAARATDL